MKMRLSSPLFAAGFLLSGTAMAQSPSFAVATIRPTLEEVKFERDGATQITPGNLHMRDVTLVYCIEWAYNVQEKQISGPDLLRSERYDIQAKADGPATEDEMRLMMRQLLAERFKFSFHRESRVMKAFALTVLPTGSKMKESAPGATPHRENTAYSTIAKAITMQEFVDFLAGPMETPMVDQTGLKGRYDFVLDFRPYLPVVDRPLQLDDFLGAMKAALEGAAWVEAGAAEQAAHRSARRRSSGEALRELTRYAGWERAAFRCTIEVDASGDPANTGTV